MNTLHGNLQAVQTAGSIALADIDVAGEIMSALLVEGDAQISQLQPGAAVLVLFQETEVSLAKNLAGLISLRNRLLARITQIDKSAILTRVVLDFRGQPLVSIITTRSAQRLSLQIGDEVEALIKANEVTVVAAPGQP
jgi:molybdate transport system regulatory protein